MASTATAAPRTGARVHVQRFGTFLSNMILPNIAAFIAWGFITALFIQAGWITLVGDKVFGYVPGLEDGQYDYGFVSSLGGWDADGGGIVGPMITYLLPILIGYTGGRMTTTTASVEVSSARSPPWARSPRRASRCSSARWSWVRWAATR